MGIGRRAFLAEFADALARLPLDAEAGIVDDLYLDRWRGIALRRPAGWEFEDLRAVRRTRQGSLLDRPDFDPDLWAQALRHDDTHEAFVVVVDKQSARHVPEALSRDVEYLAAGVTVMFEGQSSGEGLAGKSAVAGYVEADLETYTDAYRDFRVISEPRTLEVSACEAMEYTCKYSYAHAHLPEPATLRDRILYVHQGPAIYSVHMFDFPELDPPVCCTFDDFIPTLRFV